MICDLCPKAQQNLCDKYFILKPREECLMRKAQANKSIIEELEKIKSEIKEEQKRILTLDNGQYYVALCDFQKLLDNHIEELKGE